MTPTMDNFVPNHTHLFIAAHTMCDTFLQQAKDTNRTTHDHRYAVSGVLHVHAM